MSQRIKAFAGAGAEQRAELAGHWLKALVGDTVSREWCVRNRVALTKASTESGNMAGGFVVPVELDAAIIAVRNTVGAFRNCDVRRANSGNLVRPRRVSGLTASFVDEGASIPESSFELDAIEASLRKLAILVRSSTELYEDSAPDLAEFIAAEVGYAFAAAEDDVGFNGDGTSTYRGMTGLATKLVGTKSIVNAAAGHGTFLSLDETDMANLMAGVIEAAIPGAKWYVSAIGFAQVMCRLAGTGGGLTAYTAPDGTLTARFMGFPIVFSAKLPNSTGSLTGKPMLYFGDLKMSSTLVENRMPSIVAVSFQRAFDQDQVLLRGTRREHIINHLGISDPTAGYAPVAALLGG